MKSKNRVLALLWMAVFLISGGITQMPPMGGGPNALKIVNPAASEGKRLPVFAPQVGTGPVCWPGIGGCE